MAWVMKAFGLGAAAPPADYLKLSLEAIQAAAHHLDSQAGQNFHGHQCELLVQKLSDTCTILTDHHASASRDQAWWKPALRELYRVLKEAERLIEECCSEPCLKAALRQGVAYREQFMLEKAAEADDQALRSELGRWKQEHLCSVEVCGVRQQGDRRCLAAQMLERMNAEGPATDNEAACKASYQLGLWNVDYEVLPAGELLGEGSYGNVYKTTWLGDQYVKKVFRGVADKLSSFAQGVAALAPIQHRHIVPVFSYSMSEELPGCYLLMGLMSADLSVYIRQQLRRKPKGLGPFTLPAAIDLMLQIAEVMRYVHSRKMTHRELKSKNILVNPVSIFGLSEEGFVVAKLADFDVVQTKNECTRFSHLPLDRRWMATEILKKSTELEYLPEAFPMEADVYNFGIVCYEILSGKQPFEGEVQSTLYQNLRGPDPLRPQLPTSCPGRLASLIRGCWVGDPQERPAFTDVCKELRYLKGLLMTNDQEQLQKNVEMAFRTRMVKRQGPWGYSHGGSAYYDGLQTGIRAFKLWHQAIKTPSDLTAIQIEYDLNGNSFTSSHGHDVPGLQLENTGWIKFNYPEEYLVQVEGSTRVLMYGHTSPVVTSLTFTTNQKTYGPYGDVNSETVFRTDYGKVVGFFGSSGWLMDSIGVLMLLDEELVSSQPGFFDPNL